MPTLGYLFGGKVPLPFDSSLPGSGIEPSMLKYGYKNGTQFVQDHPEKYTQDPTG